MTLFMMVGKHTAESCPAHHPQYKAATLAWFEQIEALSKKYGIKQIGFWNDHPAHMVYSVFDAPNFDAVMGLSMEPVYMAMYGFQAMRVFPVMTGEQVYKMIKESK
jgi:hypothetical protein